MGAGLLVLLVIGGGTRLKTSVLTPRAAAKDSTTIPMSTSGAISARSRMPRMSSRIARRPTPPGPHSRTCAPYAAGT
ncbi:hypothetical protein [Actinacidiphila oryziradicis]|uniref:hypothetical protein n=1 Tax=Actinacidiphila oryziradicis TaxID=2571141 RepID=UPI00145C427E|nr:hypothetical protein [Actinacidiphila oryziradicis]